MSSPANSDSGSERSRASQELQETSDLTIIKNGIQQIHQATLQTRDYVHSHLEEYETRFKGFDRGLSGFKRRFDRIDKHCNDLDESIDRMGQRFDGLEQFLRGVLAVPGDLEDDHGLSGEAPGVMDEDVRAQNDDAEAEDEEVEGKEVEEVEAEEAEAEEAEAEAEVEEAEIADAEIEQAEIEETEVEQAEVEETEIEQAEAEQAEAEQAEVEEAEVGETNDESEDDQRNVKKPQRCTKAPRKPYKAENPAKTPRSPSKEREYGKGIYSNGYTTEDVTPDNTKRGPPDPNVIMRELRRQSRLASNASAANTTTDDHDLNDDDDDDGGAKKKRKRSKDATDGGKPQIKSKKPKKTSALSSVKENVEETDEHGNGAKAKVPTATEDYPIESPSAPRAEALTPSKGRKRKAEHEKAAEVADGEDDVTAAPGLKKAKKAKREKKQDIKQEEKKEVKQETKTKVQPPKSNNSKQTK